MPTPIIQVPTGLIYQTTALDHGAALTSVATAYEGSGILYQLITLSATPGWADLQAKRMAALDATLTGYWHRAISGTTAALPTGVASSPIAGGGWRITAGGETGSLAYLSKEQVLQDPSAVHWAVAVRAAFNAPEGVTGDYHLGWLGLMGEDASGYGIYAAEYFGKSTPPGAYGSETNMVVMIASAAGQTTLTSSVAVDANVLHDWLIAFDGTTITFQRDGATIGTTTTLTHVPAVPVHIAGRGNAGHYVDVTDIAFGFVRP